MPDQPDKPMPIAPMPDRPSSPEPSVGSGLNVEKTQNLDRAQELNRSAPQVIDPTRQFKQ